MSGPSRFDWTSHARAKARREAWVPADIERAVAEHHARRQGNPGDADWLLRIGRMVVAYDWPHEGDRRLARIVTVWRRPR